MKRLCSWLFFATCVAVTYSTTIAEIQGTAYQSPLAGKLVQNVTGLVTAKASNGFYIAGDRVKDVRVSSGLSVFSTSTAILDQVAVGDYISLGGRVADFRSASTPNNLFLTELESPVDIVVISSNNTVTPLVLGKDRKPPTRLLSALDVGEDGFLGVPNNSSRIETVNADLQPSKYGMDFWESLSGQLVTVPKPTSLGFPNNFGEFWVHGDWPVTGKNSRGGLTITFGPEGVPDGNPEAVIIGSPLDKSKNPKVVMGMRLSDITGVVTYQFGFYYVLPVTAPSVVSTPSTVAPPTKLTSETHDDCVITVGDYNVENMAPTSAHLPIVASQIATHLRTPDIMFIQEIQDNSGPKDDGNVAANVTLTNLVNAIAKASNVTYDFAEIAPVDGQDGGQPGGNIRVAYLYRPDRLSLVRGSPEGGSLDRTEVESGPLGSPILSFNPGRIDPTNVAWNASRKPLAAMWQTRLGHKLFTINVHLTSKGGSTSTQGDARPPVNLPIDQRTSQVDAVADFAGSILKKDPRANIVVGGDFNEYLQTRSVFRSLLEFLTDIDEVADIPPVERYSYVFDQNSQQLDHVFVSDAVKRRKAEFEHVHVNTWAPTIASRVSDHDPSVGRIRVC